jgi:hypothetical protein
MGKNQVPGSGIYIPDPQHCPTPSLHRHSHRHLHRLPLPPFFIAFLNAFFNIPYSRPLLFILRHSPPPVFLPFFLPFFTQSPFHTSFVTDIFLSAFLHLTHPCLYTFC